MNTIRIEKVSDSVYYVAWNGREILLDSRNFNLYNTEYKYNTIIANKLETMHIKHDQYRSSIYIEVVLTNKCNIKCDYCSRNILPTGAIENRITAQEYTARIREIVNKSNPEKVRITFTGGEPLTKRDMMSAIISGITDMSDFRGRSTTYALETNGTLLTINDIINYKEIDMKYIISSDRVHGISKMIRKLLSDCMPRPTILSVMAGELQDLIAVNNFCRLHKYRHTIKNVKYTISGIEHDKYIDIVLSMYNQKKKGMRYNGDIDTLLILLNSNMTLQYLSKCPVVASQGYAINPDGTIAECNAAKEVYNTVDEYCSSKEARGDARKECQSCHLRHYCRYTCYYDRVYSTRMCDVKRELFEVGVKECLSNL
ncbi:MAG TPA: radical SAM protein [Candidatus Sabulitectum sp.]|nr:radical SAM protein [Candidatus Sabulitectum sp.]